MCARHLPSMPEAWSSARWPQNESRCTDRVPSRVANAPASFEGDHRVRVILAGARTSSSASRARKRSPSSRSHPRYHPRGTVEPRCREGADRGAAVLDGRGAQQDRGGLGARVPDQRRAQADAAKAQVKVKVKELRDLGQIRAHADLLDLVAREPQDDRALQGLAHAGLVRPRALVAHERARRQ